MAERYLKLFTLQPRLYLSGSPIIIEAGALHKDTVVGDVVAQLKFSLLSDVAVTSITVNIACFDAAKKLIVPSFVYEYNNLTDSLTEIFFGQKTLITLPDKETRSFSVKITKVMFSDGKEITLSDGDWKEIPKQQSISDYDSDFEKYFKLKYGNKAVAEPALNEDIWLCTCQNVNKKDNSFCSNCGIEYSTVFPFDINEEKKNCIYEKAQGLMNSGLYDDAIKQFKTIFGWKDTDEKIYACQKTIEEIKENVEIERKQAEKRAKRNKRIAVIASSIVCVIIAFVIVLNTVIIPNGKYHDAVAFMEEGNFDKAYSIFVNLGNYKDSEEKAIYTLNFKLQNSKVGDYVKFGLYEQDNISNSREEIEWLVLEKNDYNILLLSRYILDCQQFNNGGGHARWEDSTVREWLNNSFFNNAFNRFEKNLISESDISADENPYYDYNENSLYENGIIFNDTKDRIFLLSIKEVKKYFSSNSKRLCKPTEYAKTNSVKIDEIGNCCWWLRTNGVNVSSAARVDYLGTVEKKDYGGTGYNTYGVRPALRIDLSKMD